MEIYWSKKDIPALKEMNPQQRADAIKPVMGKVWRHWQVWLPFVIQLLAYACFVLVLPQFPYRLFVLIAVIFVTVKIAALPMHHYIQHYLGQNTPPSA
ncbi:hypothetical protein BH11PSE11_BH11PSE11_03340 [soil metagenome]